MKAKDTYWQDIEECISDSGGVKPTEGNKETHSHCLFIELCNGGFSGNWVFNDRDIILSLLGSDEFRYLLSRFDDLGYLISTHIRDNEDD